MTKELMTQWHPAFCSAMKLELIENKDDLSYTNEYNLNSKPLQIDLLIIKKHNDTVIKNEIGKLFRKHNIIEYKSPEDSLNLDTFIKTIGYACIYKANESHINEILLNDITLTFVREKRPTKLITWFLEHEFTIEEPYPGIFYIHKSDIFPIQLIVSNSLSHKNQKWLTLLTSNMNHNDAVRLVSQINHLEKKDEQDLADSVLQIAIKENEPLFEHIKEGELIMCEALRELFKPELDAAISTAVETAVEANTEKVKASTLFSLVEKGLLTLEQAAEEASMSVAEFTKTIESYKE